MSEPSAGFIKLYRQITEWEHYKDPLLKDIFIHILLTANYADRGGQTKVKGTLRISMKKIAESTGYSYDQVRYALQELSKTGEISVEREFRSIRISVLKWDEFQAKTAFKTNCNARPVTDKKQKVSYGEQPKKLSEWSF